MFQPEPFISKYITHRTESLFAQDIENNQKDLSRAIKNQRVLVIGGAGTIGSSFIKALLPYEPLSMVVVDINENGLTELTRDLRSANGMYMPEDYVTYPMSYAGPVFEKMFKDRGGFDIVANFSAHKHVRSEKDEYAVEALLENNVLKARNLLMLLAHYPPKHFFCVSTDKAANPVNIMGASKKVMEEMIMAYADKFKVTTARFANVAFSNGSLPAGFLERIAKRQPLSAPSDVTRYFVSPQESGQICMLACLLGKSGEIFFPKLRKEQMMDFTGIAIHLLEELGYQPKKCYSAQEALDVAENLSSGNKEYPVYFSKSDTTGEKACEEFFTDTESVDMSRYHSLGVVEKGKTKSREAFDGLFNDLKSLFGKSNVTKQEIVEIMKGFLPNFRHEEKGQYLDGKM